MNGRRGLTVGLMVFFFLLTIQVGTASPPEAIQLKKKLEKKHPEFHGEIYYQIRSDTSLLEPRGPNKALIQSLMDVGIEQWWAKLIVGHFGNRGEELKPKDSPKRLMGSYRHYVKMAQYLQGKPFLKVWIRILPKSPYMNVGIRSEVQTRLKSYGSRFLKEYLKLAKYTSKSRKLRGGVRPADYRWQSSASELIRVVYETARRIHEHNQNEEGKKSGKQTLTKKIKEFSWRVLEDKNKELSAIKIFSVALLLDLGVSENKIRKRLFLHPEDVDTKKDFFRVAKEWQAEYPKWPVGDEEPSEKSKVTICHIPPENPSARHTIKVGKPALKDHLDHGDHRGACEN